MSAPIPEDEMTEERLEELLKASNLDQEEYGPPQIPEVPVRQEIDELRRKEGKGKKQLRPFEVHRGVANFVIQNLRVRGQFYHDGTTAYIFLKDIKRLVPVRPDEPGLEALLLEYGLAPGDKITKQTESIIRLTALKDGKRQDIRTFSHYDEKAGVLYVSDLAEGVYRIGPDGIDRVDNGTDRVLFVSRPRWAPINVDLSGDPAPSIWDVLLSSVKLATRTLAVGDGELLFQLWFWSLFFPELFPTQPLLAIIGDQGSGKTTLLRRVGQLLLGPSFNVMPLTSDPRDFDAAVTSEPLVILDNVDTPSTWLQDRLAIVATGATIKRREYYSTNRLVEFRIIASLAITTRRPAFRRPDVADRLLPLYLERLKGFEPEARMLAEVQDRRQELLHRILLDLQLIVKELQTRSDLPGRFPLRMADFAVFARKVGPVIATNPRVTDILEGLSREQSRFEMEGDPMIRLISLWLAEKGGENVGREVSTAELCKELAGVGERREIVFPYREEVKGLGEYLSREKAKLGRVFDLQERRGRGRQRWLRFRPRASA